MADAAAFRLTYTPDYGATFAVQRQARRYHFSAMQRYVWWLLPIAQVLLIFAVLRWDEQIRDVMPHALDPTIVFWSPLGVYVVLAVALWLLVCGWLAPKISARWLAQRKAPEPLTFEALPDRMQWESRDGGMWVRWESVERMFITSTAACFLVGGMTYFIPRNVFADAAALRNFIELALSRLSEPARQASLADKSIVAARVG